MARRNRRRIDEVRPLSSGFSTRRQEGDFIVQRVSGSQAGRTYLCPGCNQEIRSEAGHVVAWSVYDGPDGRRHWHTACWGRRR